MNYNSSNSNVTAYISVIILIVSFLSAIYFMSQAITEHYDKKITVCLDAGHGGTDTGAISTDGKRSEKDDNLKLALKIKKYLTENNINVILTRDTDTALTLEQRCKTANDNNCNLFISIHRNSSPTGNGIEAWISKNEKNGEKKLAKEIIEKICAECNQNNRGVKLGYRNGNANNYYVNANTKMASVLLEIGFITDENDNATFDNNTETYAKIISDIITDNFK